MISPPGRTGAPAARGEDRFVRRPSGRFDIILQPYAGAFIRVGLIVSGVGLADTRPIACNASNQKPLEDFR